MDTKRLYSIVFLGICLSVRAFAMPTTTLPDSVVAITSDQKPFIDTKHMASLLRRYGKAVTFHNLDEVDALEKQWSEGLPENEARAKKVFEERLSVVGKATFEAQFKQAYAGLIFALHHNIDRYPVIIFDNHYLVYGVTDLSEALDVYRHFRLSEGE